MNVTIVENWRKLLKRSAVVWIALGGVFGPELLQVIADNVNFVPWLDDDWKNALRLLCLCVIPFARITKQQSISGPVA